MSAESSLKWPELYKVGQRHGLSKLPILSASLVHAVYISLVLFFIPCGVFYDSARDFQTMAVTVAMSAIFIATVEVGIILFMDGN